MQTKRHLSAIGTIITVAGNGSSGYSGNGGLATKAQLHFPTAVAFDSTGNFYIADAFNNVIRKVTKSTGVITTVVGTGIEGYSGDGGPATKATLNYPHGLAIGSTGNIYITDMYNHVIRMVTKTTGIISTVIGKAGSSTDPSGDGGPATKASLHGPTSIAFDAAGNIFIADLYACVIRKVTKTTGIISTVVGTGAEGPRGDGGPASSARLYFPISIAFDAFGNYYIAEYVSNTIRKVTVSTGIITTVAGIATEPAGHSGNGGQAIKATLNHPSAVAVDGYGNLYIADKSNHIIRKVTKSTGVITTVAGKYSQYGGQSGDNGLATSALLGYPTGIALDGIGNAYVSDFGSARIRLFSVPPLSVSPTLRPTQSPSAKPTLKPTLTPTRIRTIAPTVKPTTKPTVKRP